MTDWAIVLGKGLGPLLWIELTFACFHSSGNSRFLRDDRKIIVRGFEIASAISCSTLGWMASGPGDLLILSLSSFFLTISSDISMLSISISKTLFWNSGMFSFGCSTVKTLLKYCNRTSAFSVSDEVNYGEFLVPGTCKSGTFALVLSLDCVYFQNRFRSPPTCFFFLFNFLRVFFYQGCMKISLIIYLLYKLCYWVHIVIRLPRI